MGLLTFAAAAIVTSWKARADLAILPLRFLSSRFAVNAEIIELLTSTRVSPVC